MSYLNYMSHVNYKNDISYKKILWIIKNHFKWFEITPKNAWIRLNTKFYNCNNI